MPATTPAPQLTGAQLLDAMTTAHDHTAPAAQAEPSARAASDTSDWYAAGVAAGYQLGHTDGRADAEDAMAAAWIPVAERVRASAGQASWRQLLEARGEYPAAGGGYRATGRPGDHPGGPVTWPEPTATPATATGRRRS